MLLTRRIREHRSAVILTVIVVSSLVSLASGAPATFLQNALHTVVTVTSKPFLEAMKGTKDGVGYVTGLVFAYDDSREEIATMRRQFAEQMQFVADRRELREENRRLRGLLQFMRSEPRLVLEPVEILSNYRGILTIDKGALDDVEGILEIDRGAVHGAERSMCVVTKDGVLGLVTEVDPTTSTVITLRNVNCKVGAMIRRNRVRGMVHGSGSDLSTICTMEYIDMKDEILEGDEVVTSPESLFPSGYPIGRVVAVHDTGTLWKYAEVLPAVDPYRVDEALIVRQAAIPSEELAQAPAPPETDVSMAPALPDNRTIQERYAP